MIDDTLSIFENGGGFSTLDFNKSQLISDTTPPH